MIYRPKKGIVATFSSILSKIDEGYIYEMSCDDTQRVSSNNTISAWMHTLDKLYHRKDISIVYKPDLSCYHWFTASTNEDFIHHMPHIDSFK